MGFLPATRTEVITPNLELWPMLAPNEGSDPLMVTINAGLTFLQLRALPNITVESLNTDVCPAIAPHVLDWNCEAINLESGEREQVPPPAVGGWEVFQAVHSAIWVWLGIELRTRHLGGDDRKKDARRSNATPPTSNAAGSDSPPLASKRRRPSPMATT